LEIFPSDGFKSGDQFMSAEFALDQELGDHGESLSERSIGQLVLVVLDSLSLYIVEFSLVREALELSQLLGKHGEIWPNRLRIAISDDL
jgi:hypothetical protein